MKLETATFGLCLLVVAVPAAAEVRIDIYGAPQPVIDGQAQAQQRIDSVPGNASLVDDTNWNNSRAATVKDLTDYVPGVVAQPRNGAESSRLSIRGSGLATAFQGRGLLLLQDGIPINMADGEFEFPAIDPWLIQFAEVYPGANALEYGSSNFGGAINFITPNGTTAEGYRFRAEGGSFGTVHGQVSAGQAWQNGDLFASVTGFSQDGFRAQNEQQTGRFNGNWGWHNDRFSNRIYLSHTDSEAEIPGTLSQAEIHNDPRQANPANLAGDYQRNLQITRLADKSAWEDGNDRVDTALFYTYRHLDNPVTTYEFQQNHDVGLRTKYTHKYGESQWLIGINSYYGTADESRFRNVAATTGAPILTRDLEASTNEAFGQIEQQLVSTLYGIAGLQLSYATRNIGQQTPNMARQNEDYAGASPSLGLRWDVTPHKQVFANLSRSFEPPTWGELSGGNSPGFSQLDAQTATTAEIGTRGQTGALHWQAAYYHGWLRDEFVNYRFPDGSTDTINAPRSKRDGVELGLNGDAAHDLWVGQDALVLRAAYTYSHFTLDNDAQYGNNTLPGVPEHYLRAETLYRHPSGISFGPNVEWSPEAYPVDLTNTVYTDSYAIYGLRAFWESEDQRMNLYLEGRNLLDRHYVTTSNVVPDAAGSDGRYFYPGEGRAVYAGLRWQL